MFLMIALYGLLALRDAFPTRAELAAPNSGNRREITFGAGSPPAFLNQNDDFTLIADGSFEASSSTSPWSEEDTTGCISWIGDWFSITNVDAFDGSQYLWAGGNCGGENSNSASQQLYVPLDDSLLSFHYYAQRLLDDSPSNDDYAYVSVNGNQVWHLDMTKSNNTSVWQEAEVDLSTYAGDSITLAFGAVNGSDSGYGNIYFDYAGWNAKPSQGDVPISLRRRATQFLEEMRSSSIAPEWDTAYIDEPVRPLYRPDLTEIAYYEFPVIYFDGYDSQPAGFIIVSTDSHDYTIAHWSSSGDPPSWELSDIALSDSEYAVKFYKLDTQGYAAENESGELVAFIGELPPKVIGMDPDWLENPPEETEIIYTPDEISGTLEIDGPTPPASFEVAEWDSWDDLKTNYSDSLGVMVESLQKSAQIGWDAETQINQNGVVLYKGDIYRMALIEEHGTAYFSGSGVALIQYEVENTPETPPVLVITVNDSVPGEQVPVNVDVEYDSGASETVPLLIIEPASSLFLPMILGGNGSKSQALPQATGAAGTNVPKCPWGWNCVWAGGYWDQRWYYQIPEYCFGGPYYDTCKSGCGATAWAMLFGWADYRASIGDPVWASHWGIYRENGLYGNNAEAPFTQDPTCLESGIKNITWEMRGYLGTWCNPFGGSAATFPGDMIQATRYLWWRDSMRVVTHYNYAGAFPSWLGGGYASQENYVYGSINRGTPAIVGTGYLKHYAVAYGYMWRKVESCFLGTWPCNSTIEAYFLVNDGCGARQISETSWILCYKWVPAKVWFAGEIYP
jgi:hypothetical protein